MRRLFVVSVPILMFVASVASAHAQANDGEALLKAREAALLSRNVESVLQLFAENALVVTSSGRIFVGRDQIRGWVQDQVDRNQREEAGARYRQGAKLSWPGRVYRDDWEKMRISPLDVTQDAVMEDGKIRFFNTTFTSDSAARFSAARKAK